MGDVADRRSQGRQPLDALRVPGIHTDGMVDREARVGPAKQPRGHLLLEPAAPHQHADDPPAEWDQNFRIDAGEAGAYVVKIANRGRSAELLDFENAARRQGIEPRLPGLAPARLDHPLRTCPGSIWLRRVEKAE